MSQLSEEDAVKAEEEGHLVAVEDHPEVDDWRLSLVHLLLRGRGLLVLEHHPRILARVELLWRGRGLAEVPATTAGRGRCHHGGGVVGVLPLLDDNGTGASCISVQVCPILCVTLNGQPEVNLSVVNLYSQLVVNLYSQLVVLCTTWTGTRQS